MEEFSINPLFKYRIKAQNGIVERKKIRPINRLPLMKVGDEKTCFKKEIIKIRTAQFTKYSKKLGNHAFIPYKVA